MPECDEQTVIEILRHGEYLQQSKENIVSFFHAEPDDEKKAEYLKTIFPKETYCGFYRKGTKEYIGYRTYDKYLDLIDGKEARFETLFSRFTKGYGNTVLTYFLYSLLIFATMIPMIVALIAAIFVSALVTAPALATLLNVCLVLIGNAISLVLCILVTYRYALTFFILAEYPTLRAVDVLRNSAALMKGNKWKFFCLQISFIGWALLLILVSFVTCGIGSIIGQSLLYTYVYTAQAAFYHDVAKRDAANDVEFPSLDPNDYNPDEDPNRPF